MERSKGTAGGCRQQPSPAQRSAALPEPSRADAKNKHLLAPSGEGKAKERDKTQDYGKTSGSKRGRWPMNAGTAERNARKAPASRPYPEIHFRTHEPPLRPLGMASAATRISCWRATVQQCGKHGSRVDALICIASGHAARKNYISAVSLHVCSPWGGHRHWKSQAFTIADPTAVPQINRTIF